MERKTYRHGRLAEALVEDALELLQSRPAEELSLRELAERAGVSPRAPYGHFASKEELLVAVAERGFEMLAQEGARTGGGLLELGQAYIGLAASRPHLFRLMFGGRIWPDGCQTDRESFDQLLSAVARVRPELGGREMGLAALALWGFVHGLASLRVEGMIPKEPLEGSSLLEMGGLMAEVLQADSAFVAAARGEAARSTLDDQP